MLPEGHVYATREEAGKLRAEALARLFLEHPKEALIGTGILVGLGLAIACAFDD